ncbi:MAG: SulP family inorganic anion transporter, partial [Desulfobulbaceae bacterium]|nr:SulP family inorganic anion transporter [Desulfobulbaceae bacterium]
MKRFKLVEKKAVSIKDDVLAGLTVALALVPEAVAFAFIAGVSPIVGLYGAFMMGLVTSVIGGRPGMISGATGATAIVMVSLVKIGTEMGGEGAGLQYLFATLLLAGLIQILAGVFRFGKFVRLIPHPVMMGFVNGLAIVIFTAQLSMFKVDGAWMQGSKLYTMFGLVALTMAILYVFPKITNKVPAALIAIVSVTLLVIFTRIDTQTVLSFVQANGGAGIQAGLPVFNVPMIPFNLETLYFIAPYAAIVAAIGLIESLMTLNLIDELTNTHGNGNKESIAQGTANIVNGFMGGMGGCAMIGQSIINIKSGGRGRLSGIVAALSLLIFILFGAAYIEMIPVAALVGVMFMVVIGTFAWSTFSVIDKIPLADALVILLVTVLTVMFDLAIAV